MCRVAQGDSVVAAWALLGGSGLLVAVPDTRTERARSWRTARSGVVSLEFWVAGGVERRPGGRPGSVRKRSGRRSQDLARGVGLFGGAAAVRLGLVAELPAHSDDGDGGVGQGGEVAGHSADAYARAILVLGDVADVVDAVLDLPVAAVQCEDLGRAGLIGG